MSERLEKLHNEVNCKIDKMNKQFLKLQSHTKGLGYTLLDYYETYKYIENNNINIKYKYTFLDNEISKIENSITDLRVEFLSNKIELIEFHYKYEYDLNIYAIKSDKSIFDTIGFNETSYNTRLIYNTPFNELHEVLFNDDFYTDYNSDEIDDLTNDIAYEIEDMENALIAYCRCIRSVRKANRMIDEMLKNQISRFEIFYKEKMESIENKI